MIALYGPLPSGSSYGRTGWRPNGSGRPSASFSLPSTGAGGTTSAAMAAEASANADANNSNFLIDSFSPYPDVPRLTLSASANAVNHFVGQNTLLCDSA